MQEQGHKGLDWRKHLWKSRSRNELLWGKSQLLTPAILVIVIGNSLF